MAEEINTNLDTTPLPPNNFVAQDPQSAELAGYVRTKTFGREVREAIARSIELNSTRSKSAEILANETLAVTETATRNMANQVELIKAEKDAVIANATVDSEVILARGGKPTLQARLDDTTAQLEHIVKLPNFLPSSEINKAIKMFVENAPSGSTVKFPSGTYVIDEEIVISKRLTIIGDGINSTTIIFVNSDGFHVTANYVRFKDIRIFSEEPISTGDYIGIIVDNAVSMNSFYLENVDIANFDIALKIYKLWDMNLTNVNLTFVKKIGIYATGLSVNNVLSNVRIVAKDRTAKGTNGIFFDGTPEPSEGWMIANTLIFGFENNIFAERMSHVTITNSILDFANGKGIVLTSRNGQVSGGWLVSNNYIATDAGIAGIQDANNDTLENIATGNVFTNNKIIDYQTGTYGILVEETAPNDIVTDNIIKKYTTSIKSLGIETLIANNKVTSAINSPMFQEEKAGSISWSLAESPTEIAVTFSKPFTKDVGRIMLSTECKEEMGVTVKSGSKTKTGFTLMVTKKPTANNGIVHYIART